MCPLCDVFDLYLQTYIVNPNEMPHSIEPITQSPFILLIGFSRTC